MNNYQKASIIDIYGDKNFNQIDSAEEFYIDHNTIKDGIVVSDLLCPVGNYHNINGTILNQNIQNNSSYTYLVITPNTLYSTNNYKLLSDKDIDFDNAFLKYASNQNSNYNETFNYDVLSKVEDVEDPTKYILYKNTLTADNTYVFNREITPYINNSYDLINIVDYLLNRVNTLYFLLNVIKKQRAVLESL